MRKVELTSLSAYSPWREIISNQYLSLTGLTEPSGVIAWFENEWKCKIEYEWVNSSRIVFFNFEDDDYLIAVLKYGPPD